MLVPLPLPLPDPDELELTDADLSTYWNQLRSRKRASKHPQWNTLRKPKHVIRIHSILNLRKPLKVSAEVSSGPNIRTQRRVDVVGILRCGCVVSSKCSPHVIEERYLTIRIWWLGIRGGRVELVAECCVSVGK